MRHRKECCSGQVRRQVSRFGGVKYILGGMILVLIICLKRIFQDTTKLGGQNIGGVTASEWTPWLRAWFWVELTDLPRYFFSLYKYKMQLNAESSSKPVHYQLIDDETTIHQKLRDTRCNSTTERSALHSYSQGTRFKSMAKLSSGWHDNNHKRCIVPVWNINLCLWWP